MSEKVIGIISVWRPAFMFQRRIDENLFVTSDRVIVARKSGGFGFMVGGIVGDAIETYKERKKTKEYEKLSLESILKADKHNFAIPNSETTRAELKKTWTGIKFNVMLSRKIPKHKKYEWNVECLLPEKKTRSERGEAFKTLYQDLENILRPVFGDKLSVKK